MAEDMVVLRREALHIIARSGGKPGAIATEFLAAGWRPTTLCRCGCGQRWVAQPDGHPPADRKEAPRC